MSSSLLCVLDGLLPGENMEMTSSESGILIHVRVFHVRDCKKPTSSPTEIK